MSNNINAKDLINYVLSNNSNYPFDRFYIKEEGENVEIHDNYDRPFSCGLILKNGNLFVRSYNILEEAPISKEDAFIIGKNFFSAGADYATDLVLRFKECN